MRPVWRDFTASRMRAKTGPATTSIRGIAGTRARPFTKKGMKETRYSAVNTSRSKSTCPAVAPPVSRRSRPRRASASTNASPAQNNAATSGKRGRRFSGG